MKNKNIIIISIINFLFWFHIWLLMIYFPEYAKNSGISNHNIGLIMSTFNIVSLVCMIPFGILADRTGVKSIVLTGWFFNFLWIAGIIFFSSFIPFYISYIFGGIGNVLLLISINVGFYKNLENIEEKIKNRNITFFYTASTLGFMAGPFSASLIIENYGFIKSFIFDASVMFIMLILIFFIKWPEKIVFNAIEYVKDIKNRKILLVILFTVFFFSHYGTEQTAYSLFMKHNAKLTNIQIGQIFIILGLWISLITLLIGFLAKTKYMIYVYGTGLFFSGIFQFFTGLSESYSSLIIFRLFHTLGDAVCTLSLGIIISNVFHVNRLGFSFGFYLISQLIAAIPFSYISGIISFDNNYAIPFYFNGIFMTVCSLMIIIFRNRIKKIFET